LKDCKMNTEMYKNEDKNRRMWQNEMSIKFCNEMSIKFCKWRDKWGTNNSCPMTIWTVVQCRWNEYRAKICGCNSFEKGKPLNQNLPPTVWIWWMPNFAIWAASLSLSPMPVADLLLPRRAWTWQVSRTCEASSSRGSSASFNK